MDCEKLFEQNKECWEETNQKIIAVDENKRKFQLNNKNNRSVKKVRVDKCLIKTQEQKKCDYLFEVDNPITKVFYVELKGKDVEKAYKQLSNTINICKNRHQNISKKVYIVASRIPKITSTIQKLKVQCKREHQCILEMATTVKEVII